MSSKVEKDIGGRKLVIETGDIAKQASGSVMVRYGETVILAAVVVTSEPKEGTDFLPFTVEYRERTYAAGKIPGGFFKREGKLREKEILTSRLIDRSIRPLIDKSFRNEVQITVTVLSFDQENDADVPAFIGSICAMGISSVPSINTLAAVRIGRKDGKLIVNPTLQDLASSDINVFIAGTRDSILMIEGEASEVSEDTIMEAIKLAHKAITDIIDTEESIIKKNQKKKLEIKEDKIDDNKKKEILDLCSKRIIETFDIEEKIEREEAKTLIIKEVLEKYPDDTPEDVIKIKEVIEDFERTNLRRLIVEKGKETAVHSGSYNKTLDEES